MCVNARAVQGDRQSALQHHHRCIVILGDGLSHNWQRQRRPLTPQPPNPNATLLHPKAALALKATLALMVEGLQEDLNQTLPRKS